MSSSRAAKLWKRTWVGGLITGGLALLLVLANGSEDGAIIGIATGLLTLGACFELGRMGASRAEPSPEPGPGSRSAGYGWSTLLATACVGYALVRGEGRTPPLELYGLAAGVGFGAALLTGGWAARGGAGGAGVMRRATSAAGAAAWIAPPLLLLWSVWLTWGQAGLVSLLVLSKIGDVAGYYIGSALGKSHPFPRISPGKTTAGCVGSLITGTLVGGLLVAVGLLPSGELGVVGGLLAGAVINLAAQAGDLLESAVKRSAGVKDSGTWFGPSGGVLDLVDSLLLSVPAALATWSFLLG